MVKNFRLLILTLIILAAALVVGPVAAQDGAVTDDDVNAVAKDIYCPVCENTPLDVCPTQACADWRELIRTQLSEGQTPQEVYDYFARQYGDGVLANPPRRGISLVVLWILPIVLVLIGVFFFSRYVSNLRAKTAASTGDLGEQTPIKPTPAERTDYMARIEQELQKG